MTYYCTIFDAAYLSRAICMYESLIKHCEDIALVAFCFDAKSEHVMTSLALKNVIVVGLKQFENEKLLSIKGGRSKGEYCWSCKASAIKYVFDKYNAHTCTYLDADLYFFSSPEKIERELDSASVVLTRHNFTEKYDTSLLNGIYCGQFIGFRNNDKGNEILNWWEDKCLEWCFARHEDNKYGDQKYLESISTFDSVVATAELGVLGPWNMQQHKFSISNSNLSGENTSGLKFNTIFFHFHDFRFINNFRSINIGHYDAPISAVEYLYIPYAKHLKRVSEAIKSKFGINSFDNAKMPITLKNMARYFRRILTNKPLHVKVD